MSKRAPLNEHSKYGKLCTYYKKNKHLPFHEWLKFSSTFEKCGKQGLVGLINPRKDSSQQYIFKISQYINYLVQHESIVMQGLNSLSLYCPHFCKSVGTIVSKINPKIRKIGDPFDTKGVKYPIKKEVLLTEYLDNSCKFYNYIRAVDKIDETVLYNTIKQVLLGIILAQRQKQFSHYDLHSNNIMMKRCNKDLVFLYVLDENNQFCVPTLGHYPVIIDFGFSYIEDMNDGPLWPSMAHTDVGFMSDRYDWVADPKLFLVTVSGEIKEKWGSSQSKKLRRIVRNIFYPLKIDWESGWDKIEKRGASDYVTKILEKYSRVSKFFAEYDHYCIDLLQSLVIIPLEYQNYSNIKDSYVTFLQEWCKIEDQISSPFYLLYILKGIVDAARFVRAAYTDDETRLAAVKEFRKKVLACVDEVTTFCKLNKVHFEKLLCSLYVLSKNIEGMLYYFITNIMTKKEKEYARLPLQSTEQIYGAIETNFVDNYEYTNNTSIYIINGHAGEGDLYDIPSTELDTINDLHPIARGTYIYDLYKNK